MSDVKNLYTLKQPVTKKFYVDGENNIDENCIDVGFQIFSIGAFEQYFKPLDIESLTTQLETLIAKSSERLVAIAQLNRPILIEEINIDLVAEVLELIGITKEQE